MEKRPLSYLFLFVSLAVLGLAPLGAQDTHYWTHQYGTRSTLLGGTVVGSVLDLSGTYYNPGGLSLIEEPETLIFGKVFQYPRATVKGFVESDINLHSSTLGPAPSLIAGMLKIKGLGKHWLGYSILTRQEVYLDLTGSFMDERDILPSPGPEFAAVDFRLDQKLTEPWFGFTWAYKIKRNVGIGVSQYLMVRTQRANSLLQVQALDTNGKIGLVMDSHQYSYMNWRLLWKLGAAFDFDRITLGITLTTPSLRLAGRGTTGVSTTAVAQDLDGDGVQTDFLALDYKEGLKANFKTPTSLAIGSTLKLRNFRLYGTAEWFSPIDWYEVIDGGDFYSQSTGQMLSNKITHELKSVLNFGIGIESIIGPRFKAYGSFTTDYSARKKEANTSLSVTDWDIYHLMAGADFRIRESAFTLGLGYAFGGRKAGKRLVSGIDNVRQELLELITGSEFRYSSFKFIFGFSF